MSEILSGKKEICDFLRMGRKTFNDLLSNNAPIYLEGTKYVAEPKELHSWYFEFLREKKKPVN